MRKYHYSNSAFSKLIDKQKYCKLLVNEIRIKPAIRNRRNRSRKKQKSCPKKFRNIYRRTPVFEPLFNKVVGLRASSFIKKRLQHRYFAVNISKCLRTPILKNTWERLLLKEIILQVILMTDHQNLLQQFLQGGICEEIIGGGGGQKQDNWGFW